MQSLVEAGSLEGERGAYRLVATGRRRRRCRRACRRSSRRASTGSREREKAVLQTAAVIGKEFAEPVLARVAELEPAALEDALRALVAGEFVYEQALYPEAVYAFKHPLTQEVAYGSQLGERRCRRPRGGRAGDRRAAPRAPRRARRAAGAALGGRRRGAGGGALARPRRRLGRDHGPDGGAAPLAQGARAGRCPARLRGDGRARAVGTDLRAQLRVAARASPTRRPRPSSPRPSAWPRKRRTSGRRRSCSSPTATSWPSRAAGTARGSPRSAGRRPWPRNPAMPRSTWSSRTRRTPSISSASISRGWPSCDRAIELADGDPTIGAALVACPLAHAFDQKGGFLTDLGRLDEGRELIDRGLRMAAEQGATETVGWGHMLSVAARVPLRRLRPGHEPCPGGDRDR